MGSISPAHPQEDVEMREKTDRRRANNSSLQTALQIVGSHNFASNADKMSWLREFEREAADYNRRTAP